MEEDGTGISRNGTVKIAGRTQKGEDAEISLMTKGRLMTETSTVDGREAMALRGATRVWRRGFSASRSEMMSRRAALAIFKRLPVLALPWEEKGCKG